jgi:hypothetical protein
MCNPHLRKIKEGSRENSFSIPIKLKVSSHHLQEALGPGIRNVAKAIKRTTLLY